MLCFAAYASTHTMTTVLTPLQRFLAVLPEYLHAEATRRFTAQEPVLHERLSSLYGARPDFSSWFGDLMELVGRMHAARPVQLQQQDAVRAAQPDWFAGQQMLGYCTYVERFGGSLRGVAARIPHLRDMGVTYLQLLPFLRPRAGESDGGFAVASFDDVDPQLGTNSDLEALSAQLREAGISLCSDLVLNHVADDHAWAIGAARGDARLQEFFHIFPDRTMPDRHERTLGEIFPQAAPGNFTFNQALQSWVWTTFYPYQWDLNYANPAVFAEMMASLLRLANRGVEVFRLDSTAFLWKREGTNSMNQPEAHSLLQAMRAIVEIAAPGVLLKAEAIVPTPLLPAYFGSSAAPECHIAYHSSLMAAGWGALAEQDTSLLQNVIAATPPLPPSASWLSYVRCHDDIGWNVLRSDAVADGADATGPQVTARLARISQFFTGANGSYASGLAFQSSDPHAAHGSNGSAAALVGMEKAHTPEQQQDAVRRLLLLHGLALSFGALPVLYMGDELATCNDYSYTDHPGRAIDSRWLQRGRFDEQRFAERLDGSTLSGQVFMALRSMIALRRRHPELAADAPRTLLPTQDAALLALARGARFLNLSNFGAGAVSYDLGQDEWTDGVSGEVYSGTIRVQPWQMLWLDRA